MKESRNTSKYKPEFDEMVIEYLKKHRRYGKQLALTKFGKSIGVCLTTIQSWQRKHETFSKSICQGLAPKQ